MKEYIRETPNGTPFTVQASFVELELLNAKHERLAIHPDVKGDSDRRLVRAQITHSNGTIERRDFFLHDPGSAQREDDFHHFLASFIGWELPEVGTFDGREVPLHLAAIFPMLFVEQNVVDQRSKALFRRFLKIQDIARRSMEFLLKLEVGERRRRRIEIQKSVAALESDWIAARQHLIGRLGNLARLRNIPASPPKEFSSAPAVEIELHLDGEWITIQDAVNYTSILVDELEATELQQTEEVAPVLEEELAAAQRPHACFLVQLCMNSWFWGHSSSRHLRQPASWAAHGNSLKSFCSRDTCRIMRTRRTMQGYSGASLVKAW
nr:hypothetical protein [uncultured Shinella sp.]